MNPESAGNVPVLATSRDTAGVSSRPCLGTVENGTGLHWEQVAGAGG